MNLMTDRRKKKKEDKWKMEKKENYFREIENATNGRGGEGGQDKIVRIGRRRAARELS